MVTELICRCRTHKRLGFDPGVRKISWRRAWQQATVRGVAESDTTEASQPPRFTTVVLKAGEGGSPGGECRWRRDMKVGCCLHSYVELAGQGDEDAVKETQKRCGQQSRRKTAVRWKQMRNISGRRERLCCVPLGRPRIDL